MELATARSLQVLRQDEHGVIRIGSTRVTLQSVVALFDQRASAEEIAVRFDVLSLPEVYAALSFYLNNLAMVQEYVREQRQASEEAREAVAKASGNVDLRQRLLARQMSHS